jgi:single-stranded-DNA-specific exonuclease
VAKAAARRVVVKPVRIVRRALPANAPALPDDLHPVLRRVLLTRGISAPADYDYRLACVLPPRLGGIDQACAIVEQAIRAQRRIVIVGDFDCDGATGTAIALRGLRALGARNVTYGVPNRAVHGYGLSPALLDELLPQRPELLITVDNGIAAHAGVAAARRHGIRVVITDHHLPGESLPDADAIVNPNLPGDEFPSKALAGVGVMFYLLLALRARLRASGWFGDSGLAEPDLSVLLDLVALGTVADLVPLDYNNRILVEAGLRRIRRGAACPGIAALLACAKRDFATAAAADLGFAVGPRLNAAGRIDDISLGIECLLTDDGARAAEMAGRLSALNAERRELQSDMTAQAERVVNAWVARHGAGALPYGLVLFEPEWHPGIVGLVASRLKDVLGRPVIACAPAAADSDELKASGRSIAGFHLRDALADIDAAHPGVIGRFGGHAMAAGLSLRRDRLDAFAGAFDDVARRRLSPEQLDATLATDGELGSGELTLGLARQLRSAGPWGQAFPEPLFDGQFEIVSARRVGESHLRLKLRHRDGGAPVDAMLFNADPDAGRATRLHAVFQLEIDDWDGTESVRLLIRHALPC